MQQGHSRKIPATSKEVYKFKFDEERKPSEGEKKKKIWPWFYCYY